MESIRKTPLFGIACQNIIADIFKENNLPLGISNLVNWNGNYKFDGKLQMFIPLVFGNKVLLVWEKSFAQNVAERFGKSLLGK